MASYETSNKIVHIHVHCEESVLDGGSKVTELVAAAKEIGSPALAITDHGVCGAIPDFIKECEEQGIKPLPGVEAYMTKDRLIQSEKLEEIRLHLCSKYQITDNKGKPKKKALQDFLKKMRKNFQSFDEEAPILLKDYLMGGDLDLFSVFEVDLGPDNKLNDFKKEITDYLDLDNFHLLLLAVNNQGLEDLYEIVSDAHLNGFYSDPRTDLQFIRSKGLGTNIIATSACLGSYLCHLIFMGRMEEAKAFIAECKETFHSFYLELQATDNPDQLWMNEQLTQLSIETNTPRVVTTDVHFARKEDHEIHDILVAGSFNKCIHDEDRYHYSTEHYIKSVDEVRATFHDEEAIQNTLKIADMINVTLPNKPLFPKFKIEGTETPEELIRKKAWNGLFQYALKNTDIDYNRYAGQLQYELDVICNEGFADYFLIVSDYLSYAKDNDFIVGPGRGSAAGSLVAMCIRITSIDPIKYDLMFERFLSPDRISYPDIDSDLPYEACRAVFLYLKNKYEHVAQIGTKGTLAARAVCRFVGSALGYDLPAQDAFAKAIPGKPGTELKKAYEETEILRKFADMYPKWWGAMLALEGHQRQVGVHAGGVVLSPVSLTKTVPLRADSEGLETTQFDMEWIEKFLVKFDILKLDTMGLIKKTMQYAGIWGKVDIENIDLNDPVIYERIYNTLNLSGIFQVESSGMQDVIRELKPNCFEDIVAILALYRPGPLEYIPSYIRRKHGLEPVTYEFPECEDILKPTYGILVYQEQAMKMSVRLGGLSDGQSDYIRAGIAKKKIKLIDEWVGDMIYGNPEKNIQGAINRGFDEKKLLKLKEDWIKFGEYCFNRSHSVAYAKISLMTAYLKCYYPTEFMAALLTMSEGKKDKNGNPRNVAYMRECEKMGIEILPPDINESMASWTPTNVNGQPAIRYGLASIAGFSEETVDHILESKPFMGLADLVNKTNSRKVNKAKIIALLKCGTFDTIDANRNKLVRDYLEWKEEDVSSLPTRTTKANIIQYERQFLGTSVTIKSRWETIENGKENIQFTGRVVKVEPFMSKKGQEHAKLVLETAEDQINCLVFNRNWMPNKEHLLVGQPVTLKGNKSDDSFLVNNIKYNEFEQTA
jgi:DNA polymerase III subunit alpha